MGHHIHEEDIRIVERFDYDAPAKKFVRNVLLTGVVLLVLGIILAAMGGGGHDDHGGGHGAIQSAPKATLASFAPQDGGEETQAAPAVGEEAQTPAEGATNAEGADTAAPEDAHAGEDHAAAPAAAPAHGADHGGGQDDAHAAGDHDDHGHAAAPAPGLMARLLNSLLVCSFLFMGVGATSLFAICVKYAANAGWHTQLERVLMSMANMLFIGFPIMLLVFLIDVFVHHGHIYHWANPDVVAHDALLQGKAGYLNVGFFIGRNLAYFAIWVGVFMALKKSMAIEDAEGGLAQFRRRQRLAAIFLVVFALSFSSAAWDWMMSVEAHWFSTMFSVHCFATCFVTMWALLTLTTIYLKDRGALPMINLAHFHDLGKFVFAFSIFWTYIWFCEFLLIWYANIPEEGIYYYKRFESYPVLFFSLVVLNFIIPFFTLLSKGNMRHVPTLGFICCVVILGHWLDVFMMTSPQALGPGGTVGLLEIGMLVTFVGVFFAITFGMLAKGPLIAKNHPFIKESLLHHYE